MSQHYQFSADDSVSVKQTQDDYREPLWEIRGTGKIQISVNPENPPDDSRFNDMLSLTVEGSVEVLVDSGVKLKNVEIHDDVRLQAANSRALYVEAYGSSDAVCGHAMMLSMSEQSRAQVKSCDEVMFYSDEACVKADHIAEWVSPESLETGQCVCPDVNNPFVLLRRDPLVLISKMNDRIIQITGKGKAVFGEMGSSGMQYVVSGSVEIDAAIITGSVQLLDSASLKVGVIGGNLEMDYNTECVLTGKQFEIRGAISKKNGGVLRYEPIVQKREQTKGLKL